MANCRKGDWNGTGTPTEETLCQELGSFMLQMKRKHVSITARRGVSLLDRVRHCRSQCVTAGRGASLAPAPEIETSLSFFSSHKGENWV